MPDQHSNQPYRLLEKEGLYIQEFPPGNTDGTRYTRDNKVFRAGQQFIYAYRQKAASGETFQFGIDVQEDDRETQWKRVGDEQTARRMIRTVNISVLPGLKPMINHLPDYNQTQILFNYWTDSGPLKRRSISGVIENEKNIWMHPPRDGYFRILALNPYPFIKFPYTVGNRWQWSLALSDKWKDERWATWEGQLVCAYEYTISDRRTVDSAFGPIDCLEISSIMSSNIGESALVSQFHPQYGFVKLSYTNIDRSETELQLQNITDSETAHEFPE